jgi:hypothetical protein
MSIPSFPLNDERLSQVLRSEFELWVNHFGHSPVPESQDLRAFFIQWFAVFAPELFGHDFRQEMGNFIHDIRMRDDFRYKGWYEILPLDTALYALQGDIDWIRMARFNFDHHKSDLRSFVLESLLLIVDKLEFQDTELLSRTALNLGSRQFGCEECVIFLAMTQGSPEAKRNQIGQWLDRFNLNEHQTLKRLADGDFILNPFLDRLNWVARYILLRLACNDVPLQLTLFPDTSLQPPDQESTVEADLQLTIPLPEPPKPPELGTLVWQRMSDHPVLQPYIRLEKSVTKPPHK